MADAATLRAHFRASLAESDPEVAAAIAGELDRQRDQIELIASENLVSRAVLEAHGSVMTNKTVEGYPGKRYYGGAEFADRIEALGIARAKTLFGCGFANIQPHSGSQANQAVFLAFLKPGDTILSMSTNAGGHISHGHPANQTGKHYAIVSYGVAKSDERLDYAEAAALALQHKPKLVIAGGSAYPRQIDFQRLRAIADTVGALFMVDMAHFAGLVATGLHPNPFPHAHIVTTTTYKSLRGARGGVVLTNDAALAKKIDNAVFPGVQGSVLLHAVAGKTVCLGEALKPAFRDYCQAVVDNAQALAKAVAGAGLRVVSGGTDIGLMLVDLTQKGVQGQRASESLEAAGLNVNKNTIPFDPRPPEDPSGLRLSSNAGTARGLGTPEFAQVGRWIGQVLDGLARGDNGAAEQRARGEVQQMCRRFPIYR
ncbi:MAG: serine hydroxymethyltransferase [Alphaproteobacteria bacterium]|nr:serine hydroxymethyltransferase [Alphaproteobacteria bacterium]